jgi:TolB-like protein
MNVKRTFSIITVFICFIVFNIININGAYADEKMRIAVLDFEAKDVLEQDALKVSELIRNDMINSGKYIVIERAQMSEILREQEIQQTGCTDVSCAVELGKLLSANKILVGTVMKLGNEIIITGRIVDVEKGTAEFSSKSIARSDNELVAAVTSFVAELTSSIDSLNIEKKKPVVLKEEPAVKKMTEIHFTKNDYYTGSMFFLSLSAAAFAGSFYFEYQVISKSNKYDDLADKYNSSSDPIVISRTRSEMNQTKKDADKYVKYRNISLGLGGVFSLAAYYLYYYKYQTYMSSEKISNYSEPVIYPIFYTELLTNKDYHITGGLSYRF